MSKSSNLRKRKRRNLPFYSSIIPLDIVGRYHNVTKIAGKLYQDGHKSVWLSPHNQLIFNLPRKQGYQGTLIHQFQDLTNPSQAFIYFDTPHTLILGDGWLEIKSADNIKLI